MGTSAAGATLAIAQDGKSVLYSPVAEFSGADSFTYTIADPAGEQSQATANINVLDFVPASISGTVYFDVDNDGLLGAAENRISGVGITVTGTDFRGESVERMALTDHNGDYSFADLAHGQYTVTQSPLAFVIDGLESAGSAGGDTSANDAISIELADGDDATGYLFGERGRSASAIGLGDFLASTQRDGILSETLLSPPDPGNEAGSLGARWYTVSGDWTSLNIEDVQITPESVELVIRNADDTQTITEIPTPDPNRVQMLESDSEVQLLRVFGDVPSLPSEPAIPPTEEESSDPDEDFQPEGEFAGSLFSPQDSVVESADFVTETPLQPTAAITPQNASVDTWMTRIGEGEDAGDRSNSLDQFSPASEVAYIDALDQLFADWPLN